MAMVKPPYLKLYQARGRTVAYYRRDGVHTRLVGQDGKPVDGADQVAVTAAWSAAHAQWEAADRAAQDAAQARVVTPRSLGDLIAQYRVSVEFSRHKLATRKDYEKGLRPLERDFGKLLVIGLKPHHVTRLRDRYATRQAPDPDRPGETMEVDNARQANRVITVLSVLMTFARSHLGWIDTNPAERPRRLSYDSAGFKAWTRPQFDQFMASAAVTEPMKRAAALAWYTGQRKGDCVTMTRSARSAGLIEIIPAKTLRKVRQRRVIPEHPDLTAILDAAPPSDAVTLLTRPDGKPWKPDHFNHAFAAAVKAAGLPAGLSFHGLRKGMIVEAVEGGATDAELDAVVPHADPKVRQAYRRDASNKVLAGRMIGRLKKGREG